MKNKFIIAVGSNINSPEGFNPIENCNKAINELSKFNIKIIQKSSWYLSEPIPKSTQPKFYNSVLLCDANYNAQKVLKIIQTVEKKFGRTRIIKNMPRRYRGKTFHISSVHQDKRGRNFIYKPNKRIRYIGKKHLLKAEHPLNKRFLSFDSVYL